MRELIKRTSGLCAAMLVACGAQSQVLLPFYDGFNYSSGGSLAGFGNWVSGGGSGTILVGGGNFSCDGLAASTGKDISTIPSSSSARTYVNFSAQTSGTVYFSFLFKVNTAPSAQRLVAYAYSTTSSSSTPYLGLFVTTSGQLAAGISTSTPQFTSSGLTVGATNFVVVSYTFGASDTAQIWINPTSLGGSAPATTGSFTATHNSALAYFHFNTPSAGTGGGGYEFDELRIGNSWADVTPAGVITPPATNTPVITQSALLAGGFQLQGTNGNPGGPYFVISTSNMTLPRWQWAPVASNTFATNGNFICTNPAPSATAFYQLYTGATPPPQPALPVISSQPQNQLVVTGATATFNVVASSQIPLNYQWYSNTNTPLTIPSANTATLMLTNVQTTNAGGYSVVVANSIGAVTSLVATLIVSTNALGATNVWPYGGAVNVCVDTPYSITFSNPPTPGNSGLIRIYDANTLALYDSINLATSTHTKKIGGATYEYLPVLISGNTAHISMHSNLLYGRTYYVTVDAAAFTGVGAWGGITNPATWSFTTKSAGPTPGTTNLIVAADGTGDFSTVQGAVDFVPSGNTTPTTIQIRNGVYREIVFNNGRHNLTFAGQDREQAIVTYPNREAMNSGSALRSLLHTAANDVSIHSLTLSNSTPQGGSQAEAIRVAGFRFRCWNSNLRSLQDTIMVANNGDQAYFQDCLVAGNVDYVWGSGTIYFTNCEIRSIDRGSEPNGYICQPRNDAAHNGFAFVDCQLTGADNAFNTQYFARNNKNDSAPASQTVLINCRMNTNNFYPQGWYLDGSSSTAALRFWEYQTTDLTGTSLVDVSQRPSWSRQLTAPEAAAVRDATTWFNGWSPHMP